ncbi:predicted protein [Verticillium alfalfae VaMs.102]|uniref:Predicted protein n=1 Tax=Verticillium alfalfae (strain VaMs.102 / ATCC MYA-4576 / FGSC 10136) TaxID=526221 RepID=C9SCT9_VERA1|nr:predicted protein [Verticillium alfalfae VaMs.102]EEY16904.1 predicted protein [Verticillium alfalfae VaMs.102]
MPSADQRKASAPGLYRGQYSKYKVTRGRQRAGSRPVRPAEESHRHGSDHPDGVDDNVGRAVAQRWRGREAQAPGWIMVMMVVCQAWITANGRAWLLDGGENLSTGGLKRKNRPLEEFGSLVPWMLGWACSPAVR